MLCCPKLTDDRPLDLEHQSLSPIQNYLVFQETGHVRVLRLQSLRLAGVHCLDQDWRLNVILQIRQNLMRQLHDRIQGVLQLTYLFYR